MNDSVIRAISIGAGLFIAMITISAVMSYYGTAQSSIQKVGLGADIPSLTNQNITNSLLKESINGTEVKNIINYFYLNEDVVVNVSNAINFNGITSGEILRFGGNPVFGNVNNQEATTSKFITLIKNINPSQRFNLNYKTESGITTITIIGKK